MIRNQKGGVFLLLAVWQSLQPRGESFPLPTALEKCPQHGASGSLRSPVLNPTALQESWGSTAPLQAGSTHLKRYHSDLQNLPEDLRGGGGGGHPLRPQGCCTPPCAPGTPISLPTCLWQLLASPSSSGSFTPMLICNIYQLWHFKVIRDLHQETLNIEVILCKLLPLLQQGERREKPFFS